MSGTFESKVTNNATGGGGTPSPLTTKGDLYTHDASNDARLPVGADGKILIADSGSTLGIKWDTVAGIGDVNGPASSNDGEIALFDGASGKLIKAAIGSGVVHATSGVYSAAAVDLTSEVSGVLPIANGGTGGSSLGDLTDAGTDGITVTGGTGAVIGSGTALSQHVADATHNGYLSSANWSTFNNKQATITQGNLTDVGTDGIVVTGGANAVIGAGTSLAQHVADSTHNGYLSSTDWSTFNGKQAALTTGDLTDAGTDGIVVTSGAGAVIGSGTSLAQHVADATHNGYLASADWSTFNAKQTAGSYITALTGDVTASGPGSSAATIGTNKVVDTMIRQSAGVSLIGRSANTTGNVADITAASNNTVLKRSSNALSFATVVDADVDAAAAIAYSKLATLTSGNILVGNGSNVATSVAMSSEATISNAGAVTLTNSAVIGKVLTGYAAASGQVAATDTILQALDKCVASGTSSTTLAIPLWNGTTGKLLQNVSTMVGSTNGDIQLGTAGTTTLQQVFTPAGSGGNNSCDLTVSTGNGATGAGNGRAGDLVVQAGGTVSSSVATSRAGGVTITAGSTTNAANTTTAGAVSLNSGTSVGGLPGYITMNGRIAFTGIQRETSTTTVTVANTTRTLIADYGSLQATATYTLPASTSLVNGQEVRFGAGTNGVTALTLSAGSGTSITGAIASLTVGQSAVYQYVTASTTWYRVS